MAIEGPLRELGIHDVFQLLDLSRKTGVLRVTSELRHNAGTVYFDGGTIIFAEIRSNPHPLGALLLRTGKITEADLERGRDMQERQGDKRRIGEILVALGAITPNELARGVLLVYRGPAHGRGEGSDRAHPDRSAAHGRGAPHRRVVADRGSHPA